MAKNIKVIGCGNVGINTINEIVKLGLDNIETYAIDNDYVSLSQSFADKKVLLGYCASNIDNTKQIIIENISEIKNIVNDSDIIILTASMENGFVTNCISEIARVTKKLNILTIVIISKYLSIEGDKKNNISLNGIEELKRYTNLVCVLPNCFKDVNNNRVNVISTICSTLKESDMNIDLLDIKNVCRNSTDIAIKVGFGNCLEQAIENAIKNNVIKSFDIKESKDILVNICCSKDYKISNEDLIVIKKIVGDNYECLKIGCSEDSILSKDIKVLLIVSK